MKELENVLNKGLINILTLRVCELAEENQRLREAAEPFGQLLIVMQKENRSFYHGDIFFSYNCVELKESHLRALAQAMKKEER